MDIVGGLAAAGNALTIAKTLRQIDKNYDGAAYRAQIADLIDGLSEARLALVDAKEALATKEAEIAALKSASETRATLQRGDGDYQYFVNAEGERSGFPICPRCENVDSRIVQLKQDLHVDAAKCPVCSNEYRPVTCYVPASENAGTATTKVEIYKENRRIAQERANRRIVELNRDSWIDRRY